MARDTKPIAPEVEHLLAAVKAVKRGLVPERQQQPSDDEQFLEEEVEMENKEERL